MRKFSFTTLSTPGLGVREVAALARRFGYDGVDLRVSKRAGELLPGAGAGEVRAVKSVLEGEGVQAAGLMCYLEYGELDSAALSASLREQMLQSLGIAAELGAGSIRVGGYPQHTEAFCRALSDVLPQAGQIDLVIQNHADAYTTAQCLELVKALDHPRFTLVFSPDHCLIMGEDYGALYPQLRGRASKLYVADLKMKWKKYRTVLPGTGAVPIAACYEAIGGRDFDGWITFKYEKFWEPKLLGPEESLPYFIERAPLWFAGRSGD